ncbi:Gfo/Idh/MocA family oxidoreductase [Paraflavitalea speifideaquila]|uniref:Gfo/Idh/MocA family oxidoreductase n=1 Tax=Paraflavitalea speifideaquila TaxID=3076558 RepID=UPI0028F025CA|nr:Gfo/Idh/MocA family oxidoreductase [Paraflavitalea speifideiaquila]
MVTPNFAHFAPAMMALDHGFHVVIEKPITFTLDEAQQLKKGRRNRPHPGTYTYLFRLPNGQTSPRHGTRGYSVRSVKYG